MLVLFPLVKYVHSCDFYVSYKIFLLPRLFLVYVLVLTIISVSSSQRNQGFLTVCSPKFWPVARFLFFYTVGFWFVLFSNKEVPTLS